MSHNALIKGAYQQSGHVTDVFGLQGSPFKKMWQLSIASVKIRCNFYHCIKLYTCISYILCFETLISFAGDSLKLCLHVPENILAIPLTEILHWHDKWSKNGQIIALCCNISKMMFFQLEVSLYSNVSQ